MLTDTHETLDSRQFHLAVRRLADSLGSGPDLSAFVGSGIDYAQSRLYQPGDPIKNIDWRLMARTGKPYLKQYETSRRMNVYLLLDSSGSMRVTSGFRSKFDWAILLAGALALSALERMNPVAFFSGKNSKLQDRPARFQPSLLRQQVHTWLDHMRDAGVPTVTENWLSAALADVSLSTRERSIVVVLSDLHEPAAINKLKKLSQRHDVLVLRLTDPAETRPIGGGIFRGQEAETRHRFITTGRRGHVNVDSINQQLRGAKVDVITLLTDQNFIPALRLFLKQRGRRAA